MLPSKLQTLVIIPENLHCCNWRKSSKFCDDLDVHQGKTTHMCLDVHQGKTTHMLLDVHQGTTAHMLLDVCLGKTAHMLLDVQ